MKEKRPQLSANLRDKKEFEIDMIEEKEMEEEYSIKLTDKRRKKNSHISCSLMSPIKLNVVDRMSDSESQITGCNDFTIMMNGIMPI